MKLSRAEMLVFRQLILCKSYKEISQALNISTCTVRMHAGSIYRKAGIEAGNGGPKLMTLLRKFGRFEVSIKWVPNPNPESGMRAGC